MAKDNPQVVAAQYKVLLKPTDVGLLVMKRMERPHLDKSAELRRLIELGYAAEQAGFILDGTVLRHAGRAWDTQPDLVEERNRNSPAERLVKEQPDMHRPGRTQRDDSGVPPGHLGTEQGEPGTKDGEGKSALQSNLRSLSG